MLEYEQLLEYLKECFIKNPNRWGCSGCYSRKSGNTNPSKTIEYLELKKGYLIERASNSVTDRTESMRVSGTIYCGQCKKKKTHYRLMRLLPSIPKSNRGTLPLWLRKRVLELYDKEDVIFGKELNVGTQRVDHKIPVARLTVPEQKYKKSMSDKEIIDLFQPLTEWGNRKKEKSCTKCIATGKRGKPPIKGYKQLYWIGDEEYRGTCVGCDWHDIVKFCLNQ